jgi:Fe-S cluster biogenesis protein NfuA
MEKVRQVETQQAGRPVDRKALEGALAYLRPALQADGGDLELHGVDENGVVKLELLGACGGCPMSIFTLVVGLERIIMRRVPGVTGVVAHSSVIPDLDELTGP